MRMGNKQKIKIKSEIWDNMQYFCKPYHDHHVRFVLYFENIIDERKLQKALMKSMDIFPILKSRFVPNNIRSYWQKFDNIKINDIFELVERKYASEDINSFLVGIIDEENECQIKVKIFRNDNKDTLCILMNHMVCDGSGIKEYVNLLSSIYNDIDNKEKLSYKNYNRCGNQYSDEFGFVKKAKLFIINSKSEINKDNTNFILCKNNSKSLLKIDNKLNKRIFIKTIDEEVFVKLKKISKENNVTINDVLITAYYRALLRTDDIKRKEILIRSLIDLRRYLKEGKKSTICNLTSKIDCVINSDINESFEKTLINVSKLMNHKKNNNPGLNGLALLNVIFNVMPFKMGKFVIETCYNKPYIGMSNIGILKEEQMKFGSVLIKDAFITGPIKYPPYFQLSVSSFKDNLTFTAGTGFYEKDEKRVEQFLDNIEKEIQEYISE